MSNCENIKKIDGFGQPIEFTFMNQSKFQTYFGAAVTILCYSMMLVFTAVRTQKLFGRGDPAFSSSVLAIQDGNVDLWKYGFMFAIQEPDPTAGVITAEYIMRNETGIEEYYPIDMVSCDEMLPGGKHEG